MFQAPKKQVRCFEFRAQEGRFVAQGWPAEYRVAVLECGHENKTDLSPKRMACHQCPGGREAGRAAK
jgi:hypothetical protein